MMLDPPLVLILAAVFGSVFSFVALGAVLFTRGWQSYEEKYVEGAQRSLDSIYLTMPVQNVLYLSFACSLIVGAVVGILAGNVIVGAIFGMGAFPLPKFLLMYLKHTRDSAFGLQLVDALVNMGNSLKAGFSLNQALEQIHREMENPISQEIRLVTQEIRLGVSVEDALQHLLERMPSQALDLVVTAITISREIGGNLTEVFDNIADTIRERHRIEGKIGALTAQGKLQGIIISLLPLGVAIALNLINPKLMEPMFTTFFGWLMIAGVLGLEALGMFVIFKIVSIEV